MVPQMGSVKPLLLVVEHVALEVQWAVKNTLSGGVGRQGAESSLPNTLPPPSGLESISVHCPSTRAVSNSLTLPPAVQEGGAVARERALAEVSLYSRTVALAPAVHAPRDTPRPTNAVQSPV